MIKERSGKEIIWFNKPQPHLVIHDTFYIIPLTTNVDSSNTIEAVTAIGNIVPSSRCDFNTVSGSLLHADQHPVFPTLLVIQ